MTDSDVETERAVLADIRRMVVAGKIIAAQTDETEAPGMMLVMVQSELLAITMDAICNRLSIGSDYKDDVAYAETVWDKIPDEYSMRDLIDVLRREVGV